MKKDCPGTVNGNCPECREKIMAFVREHELSFTHNPGGGEFYNTRTHLRIQVPHWGDCGDYDVLAHVFGMLAP